MPKSTLLKKIVYFFSVTTFACIFEVIFKWNLIRTNNSVGDLTVFLFLLLLVLICLILLIIKAEEKQ